MIAEQGKTYVHVLNGVVRGSPFTAEILAEWNDDDYPCVEVPEGQTAGIGYSYANGVFTAPGPEPLSAVKARALAAIDEAAGKVRVKYITDIPGQEATYLAKAQQAKAYKDAGYTGDVPPFIAAEAQYGLTAQQVADRVLLLEAQWQGVIGPAIEGARVGGKDAVNAAVTTQEVETAVANTMAVFAQL